MRGRGPITVVGGKSRLAKIIIDCFPSHTCYVEAFAGGAQVFFHKQPSKVEVLNDLDGELVNFYRVCQSHADELVRCTFAGQAAEQADDHAQYHEQERNDEPVDNGRSEAPPEASVDGWSSLFELKRLDVRLQDL